MELRGYTLMAVLTVAAVLLAAARADDDALDSEDGKRGTGMSTLRFGKRAARGMASLRFGKRAPARGMNTLRFGKRMGGMGDHPSDLVDEDMMKMLLRLRALHHGKRSDEAMARHLHKIMMHMAKRSSLVTKPGGIPIELNEEELMKLLIQLRSLHHG